MNINKGYRKMDTEKKLGISKKLAILLFVQMILTVVGFAAQVGILIFVIANSLDYFMVISSCSIILSFISVFIYGVYGHKKNEVYYVMAIVLFLIAVLVNNVLPFRDAVQKILLTLLFGALTAFIFTRKNYKLSNVIIIVAAVISLAFSVYSSITADVNSLGEVEENILPVIMMFISIFTPVITVGAIGSSNLAREVKGLNK